MIPQVITLMRNNCLILEDWFIIGSQSPLRVENCLKLLCEIVRELAAHLEELSSITLSIDACNLIAHWCSDEKKPKKTQTSIASWGALHLKTVDTIGNCQRPIFSLGVSQHMHKNTNLCKFELNRSSKLRDNNESRKIPWSHEVVRFQMLDNETSNTKSEVSK